MDNLHTTYAAGNISTVPSTISTSSDFHPQSQYHQRQQQQQKQAEYKLTADNNITVTNDTVDINDTVQSSHVIQSALLNTTGINSDRRVFFQDELREIEPVTTGLQSTTEVCYYQTLSATAKNIPDIGDTYCEQQEHLIFLSDQSSRSTSSDVSYS
ncbi:unnamed protein product [Acanthocheilonema viteae]|uniref:Uncharacterized protein n=1 Tax=Acanthocheilonema viteae TaxID=6277 RepID=A0A498SJ27_ACAVI|nr:unnamed protein product [Acanthocheilonema viteae]